MSLVRALTLASAFSLACIPAFANPNVTDSAKEFHKLLMQSLPASVKGSPAAKFIHFLPDSRLADALDSSDINDSMALARDSKLDDLLQATQAQGDLGAPADIDSALRKRPLTMVIVPGIFGEFIEVRPFEDILERKSRFQAEFAEKVKQAIASGDANGKDATYVSKELRTHDLELDKLVHVGTIDDKDGATLVRVVLLYPPFASLETLGDLKDRSTIMRRRLEKYLALTGQQDLVLIGYSRGTTYALEMLAQAREKNVSWLPRVRGMIGMNGVVWGSTAADQTKVPGTPVAKALDHMRSLKNELKTYAPNANTIQKTKVRHSNYGAWTRFGARMTALSVTSALDPGANDGNQPNLLPTVARMDFLGQIALMWKFLAQLGVDSITGFFSDHSNNVARTQALIDAALTGIDQLSTESRLKWFRENTLPNHVIYYSMTSAMANPMDSPLSKEMFENPITYARKSFEDSYLLMNRNNHTKDSGVPLNDSQVAVPQATFLPKAIEKLNPSQGTLKTQFLGVLGTHHWGDVLRIVFPMRNKQVNPFPREALMKALAAKVALDLEQGSNQ